ncbi:hypothetical protein VaNZ11_000526 [Volvox africanus]|uniref:Lactoylglutathione lyase n=1 Tax=Volvox africanus TaxID=51714 RepID=A0ABQ5RMG9_9CHLO|nr:hypothetical protein VaNZ11_000526 [Volvox africanus]
MPLASLCNTSRAAAARAWAPRYWARTSAPFRKHPCRPQAMASLAELQSTPGVCANPDPATQGFVFQQTMFRIRDPAKSLDFYTRVLGMRLLAKLDFPDMKFSLYFLGYEDLKDIPEDAGDRTVWMFRQKACLELTHNWGTESDPNFAGYHNGNSDPRGFGHIGFSVPDVYAACKRFEELGVEFQKKPDDGKMKGLAFVRDPDGYWIEILNAENSRQFATWGK